MFSQFGRGVLTGQKGLRPVSRLAGYPADLRGRQRVYFMAASLPTPGTLLRIVLQRHQRHPLPLDHGPGEGGVHTPGEGPAIMLTGRAGQASQSSQLETNQTGYQLADLKAHDVSGGVVGAR